MITLLFCIVTALGLFLLAIGLGLFLLERRQAKTALLAATVPIDAQAPIAPVAAKTSAQRHSLKVLGLIDIDSSNLSLIFVAFGVVLLCAVALQAPKFIVQSQGIFETPAQADQRLRQQLDSLVKFDARKGRMLSFTSCLILPNDHARLTHYMSGLGFGWVDGHNHYLTAPGPNTALQTTVYYYNSRNKPVADTLARMLEIQTNTSFSTTIGDGHGIPVDRRPTALAVHLIADACKRPN
ncbi:MAG: hypothetical protein V4475_12030 [Pseudomonadota bacterium]